MTSGTDAVVPGRHSALAEILGIAIGVAALVAWDTSVALSLPPAVPLGGGVLAFVATAWGLGALWFAVVVLLRRALTRVAESWSRFGVPIAGALDGMAILALGVLATDPQGWSPNFRAFVVVGFLLCGAVLRVIVRPLALTRPRITAALAGVACVVAATIGLALLQWRREESARLALHLVFAVGCAALGRAWLERRQFPHAVALAVLGFVIVVATAGSGWWFDMSQDARRLLHMRSSHAHAWSIATERLFDRDHDRVTHLFGGVDCAPDRRDVFPGASEVPANGRDDNCARGDGHAVRKAEAPPRTSPPSEGGRPDVVVLSLDSVRWDAAGDLGQVRRALGHAAELTRAVTPCPRTMDALASTVRGRPARQIPFEGVPEVRGSVLWRDRSPTLGHVLTQAGYRVVVVPTTTKADPRIGSFAGFEAVFAANHDARTHPPLHSPFAYRQLPSDDAIAVAVEVARSTPKPLLLWIHMMETHAPYHRSRDDAGPETRDALRDSVRYTDGLIAGLLRELDRVRPRPRIVTVLADHGEEFGEHGSPYHGTSVYAEQVRVVWLLAGPGIPGGHHDGPASIASLPATLLDAIGLQAPATMVEPSLLPAMRGEAAWPALAVTELRAGNRTLVGYTGARYRLVADVAHDWDELFDSVDDPLEQHDLAAERPDVLGQMRELARAWDETH